MIIDSLVAKPNMSYYMIRLMLWYPHMSLLLVLSLSSSSHHHSHNKHLRVQSSRNEIHSCQLSAICKYTYNNSNPSFISSYSHQIFILAQFLFLPDFYSHPILFSHIFLFSPKFWFSPLAQFPDYIYHVFLPPIASHWCEPVPRCDARPYWISHAWPAWSSLRRSMER